MTFLIIYVVVLAIGFAFAGYDHERGGWCTWQGQEGIIMVSVFWPVAVPLIAILALCYLPMLFGKWLARRVK